MQFMMRGREYDEDEVAEMFESRDEYGVKKIVEMTKNEPKSNKNKNKVDKFFQKCKDLKMDTTIPRRTLVACISSCYSGRRTPIICK